MSRLDFYQNRKVKVFTDLEYKSSKILFPVSLLFFISIIAIILLYAAAGCNMAPWAIKQSIFISSFFIFALIIRSVNVMWFYQNSYTIYLLCILLLFVTNIFGHNAMGAQRWIDLKYFSIQPSEIMKIGVILALSRYFHDFIADGKIITKIIAPLLIVLLPVSLILAQPNLGTALIILSVSGILFFVNGLKKIFFIVPIMAILASSPFIWKYGLHDYQKRRIITFINPEKDILKSGYNIIQSKIAIGSGGMFGKGICNGTQSRLSFLPEKHNDFIFTLLAEEHGLFGCLAVLILYIILIFYFYSVANYSSFYFGKMISIGLASLIFIHIFVNVGMVSGILPVVGVPFPILSYGGSHVATILLLFGMVLSVQKSESKIRFSKYKNI